MSKKNNDYPAKFKVDFVLKALSYPDGVAPYCRKEGIKENRFYAWRQMLLENAEKIFKKTSKKELRKIQELEERLKKKTESIAALSEMLIEVKKNDGDL